MRTASMKICHLTSVHIPFDTRIFYKECASLLRAGYEVHLVAPHERDETVGGIHIHAAPVYTSKLARMLFAPWAVFGKALALDARIYHFHDPELIPAGLVLRLLGRTVIYDVHEDYPETVPTKRVIPVFLRGAAGRIIELLERFTAPWFNAVVAVTPTIHERFRSYGAQTEAVFNYPVIGRRREKSWDSLENTVCYIGSIAANRCIREIIEAVGFAGEKTLLRLELAGSFASASLEREIRELPEFSRVDYRGFLNRNEVDDLLGRVKCGLILVYPEPRYMVAYPSKLFEYMGAGIPVVASDFPLWRSIIEKVECGLLVDPQSPRAIAEAILWLLDHPREAEAMGNRGREAVERNYRWDIEEKKLISLYAGLFS